MAMHRRLLVPLLLLAAIPGRCGATDSVVITIKNIGLQGAIPSLNGALVPASLDVHNVTSDPLSFTLTVTELNLQVGVAPIAEPFHIAITLAPAAHQALDLPLHVLQNMAVVYAEAVDAQGHVLGRAGRPIGERVSGSIIGLLCTAPEVCRALRQSILLSGTEEEQTRKAQSLRLLQITDPPSEGWAYSPASTIIVATPLAGLSAEQRLALEVHLHGGGTLALVEDQLADGPLLLPSSSLPANSSPDDSSASRFLAVYRARAPEGEIVSVDAGRLVHFRAVSSQAFADYFRPLGFSESTPQALRKNSPRTRQPSWTNSQVKVVIRQTDSFNHNLWLMQRLGTTFRFPTFLALVLWIAAYLVLVGVVNFVVLRSIGRPEWGWFTIPLLAIVFSIVLYVVSARHHPKNYGLDQIVLYRLDPRSPLALMYARVRVSAPSRSVVHPILPAGLVLQPAQQFMSDVALPFGASQRLDEIYLNGHWETEFSLRRWSFRDLDFSGYRSFAGRIYRDAQGHLHNDTGINFQQAIVADSEDVFVLGSLTSGSSPDLAHVQRLSYAQETGRSIGPSDWPGPPFLYRQPEHTQSISSDQLRAFEQERKSLSATPFSILELIRGWPNTGDDVFADTKAVFLGISTDATLAASLRDRAPEQKAFSIVIVTFKDWP